MLVLSLSIQVGFFECDSLRALELLVLTKNSAWACDQVGLTSQFFEVVIVDLMKTSPSPPQKKVGHYPI